MENIKKKTFKAWVLASRPNTLPASACPVFVASALAYSTKTFNLTPALICLFFALTAQIISNFANDYFDYKKGIDNEERLGPKRAVAEGWIKPKTMLYVTLVLLVFDALLGLSLVFYGGWQLIIVGVVIVIFALAYSGGPYPLSSNGLGDVCVMVFFGLIPVGFTYYVQALSWNTDVIICGLAMGFVITNILVANNYRDRDTDKNVGKKTTIVIFGEVFGSYFYLFNGVAAALCCMYFLVGGNVYAAILPLFYLPFHIITWRKMISIYKGMGLIQILKESSRNLLIFSLLLAIGLMF
ncbi:1,4-dihydroxy-2-naphthoate octaprenyltransferase [Dysgonomonadaceae bacterium PH5-43]|nr:1,4-dihydroxy-2-naphthoate octaprenyltransferase [Dysgonomonadaceae bacterium PH5-43]